MNQQMKFCTLELKELPSILRAIVQANRNTNPLLISKQQTIENFTQQAQQLIQACFVQQQALNQTLEKPIHLSFGIRLDEELIAVMMGIDMALWLKMVKPSHRFFRVFKDINMDNVPSLNTAYFQRLSVVPHMMRKGVGKRLVYESAKYLSQYGYQQSVVGCLVEASCNLFMGLGGQVLVKEDVYVPNLSFQLWMISNSYSKLIQIYESSSE